MKYVGFKSKNQVAIKPTIVENCMFTHSLATGPTGSGKTVSFISTAIKQRLRDGHSIFAFDEKGTLHLSLKALAVENNISLKSIHQFGVPEGMSINLIDGYNEKKMIELAKAIINKSKEPFWENAAHSMLTKTFIALKKIKELMYAIQRDTGISEHLDTAYIAVQKNVQVFSWRKTSDQATWYEINIELNTRPLVFNDIALLFSEAKYFILYAEHGEELLERMMEKLSEEDRTLSIKSCYEDALVAIKALSTYVIKIDLSEASGNSGVYFCVASSIKPVMDPLLNDPFGLDINTILENKEHVIVSCESFTHDVISIVLSSVLSRFLPRAKMKNKSPITVIIDEAYRVLSASSDLYTDILREAHVDVVMATQNEAQMIERLGDIRWQVFQENFLNRISYGSSTKKLNPFEYQHHNSSKIYKAEPIFIDQTHLYETEQKYQQENGLYQGCRKSNNEVIIFDRALFDDKHHVIVYDLKTKEESTRPYEYSQGECLLDETRIAC